MKEFIFGFEIRIRALKFGLAVKPSQKHLSENKPTAKIIIKTRNENLKDIVSDEFWAGEDGGRGFHQT